MKAAVNSCNWRKRSVGCPSKLTARFWRTCCFLCKPLVHVHDVGCRVPLLEEEIPMNFHVGRSSGTWTLPPDTYISPFALSHCPRMALHSTQCQTKTSFCGWLQIVMIHWYITGSLWVSPGIHEAPPQALGCRFAGRANRGSTSSRRTSPTGAQSPNRRLKTHGRRLPIKHSQNWQLRNAIRCHYAGRVSSFRGLPRLWHGAHFQEY